eukprot:TRINITY_DN1836_c0_g1_i3.p1 TRINITY_DN1836_c0_g1~~TRINITY_DN1836_c0_g1_i3.p1  ORF type:complete len:354 (+),score=51.84 TRINITY_DN1836_c0_g1_i3:57-1118(+)
MAQGCQFYDLGPCASLVDSIEWHAVRDDGLDGSVKLPPELSAQLPEVSNQRHPCRYASGSVGAHKDGDGSAHLSSWICLLYLEGSGTFTFIPDDPALPALSSPIHPGLLVKFDNRVGRHSIIGAEVNGEAAARIFVGPLTVAGILGRGGTCDWCGEEFHCGNRCTCSDTCDCGGICRAYSKRHWQWLQCSHTLDVRLYYRYAGRGNVEAEVDGCEYCGGALWGCIQAGTVPVTVNVSHDQTTWTQINLSKINGEVLTTIDLVYYKQKEPWDKDPTVAGWKVRDLLGLLRDEMQKRMGSEAARNIYLTPNGLCLSKARRDLESLPLHEFMAFEQNQCCDPEWHGWYCHVCQTQH